MNMNTEQYAQALNVLSKVQRSKEAYDLSVRKAVAKIKTSAIEKLDKISSTA